MGPIDPGAGSYSVPPTPLEKIKNLFFDFQNSDSLSRYAKPLSPVLHISYIMAVIRPTTRGGKRGHLVRVKSNTRFVPSDYPGNDPRTKAKKRGRW